MMKLLGLAGRSIVIGRITLEALLVLNKGATSLLVTVSSVSIMKYSNHPSARASNET